MPTTAGQAILDVFDSVRIINLRSRPDRRKEISRQLARLGLHVDGHKIAFHDACRPADAGKFPTIGTRGCFISHLDVLIEAREQQVGNVLILEDDANFAARIEERLPAALAALTQSPWSIFYGGHIKMDRPLIGSPLSVADPELPILTAYMIGFTREAIELAVPYLQRMKERPAGDPEGGPMHVDGAYNWLRRAYPALQTQLAVPMLGHQRPSRTDIHALGLADRTIGLRTMVGAIRRIKHSFAVQAY